MSIDTSAPGTGLRLPFPDDAVYVDGNWQVPADAAPIEVIDPATEEVLATVPESGPDVARRAVDAATRAFAEWSRTPVTQRVDYLRALADAMEAESEGLATVAAREIGMPVRDARGGQVALPVNVLRSVGEIALGHLWEYRDAAGNTVCHEPIGVVVAITPWNFPVHQIIAKLAPALAAGCTLVLKPAETTPLNALYLAALFDRVGIPGGVVNVVTGTGPITGEALLAGGGYDLVSFTGSLAVGRHIGATAGQDIVRATLELGGKSPAIVLDDADLEAAVTTTVRNCFVNAGQKCNAPTRLLVPAARLDDAVEIAARAAEEYVLGDPLDADTTMGPLASAEQLDKVTRKVVEARERGVRVATGGQRAERSRGYYFEPTIVTDVDVHDPIWTEEVFGPVLIVHPYRDADDALALAHDTEYGLSAEVWSGDPAAAAALARRLRAGQVRVNGVRTAGLPVSPFGGYKRSGLGRELGAYGLTEFIEVKAILGDPLL